MLAGSIEVIILQYVQIKSSHLNLYSDGPQLFFSEIGKKEVGK